MASELNSQLEKAEAGAPEAFSNGLDKQIPWRSSLDFSASSSLINNFELVYLFRCMMMLTIAAMRSVSDWGTTFTFLMTGTYTSNIRDLEYYKYKFEKRYFMDI